MSQRSKTVDHLGKIQEVTHDDVLVSIQSHTACSGCHAKNACGMSDSTEKIVVVHKPNHNFTIGQNVKIILKQSHGFKALFLGYLLPFVVVIFTLITLMSINISEGLSGLIALLVLVPYYVGLYIFKDNISHQFNFDIELI